jgi:hypothetical protein
LPGRRLTSDSVIYFVLDPSRSADVIICDRYSAYKKFARLHPGVLLAFCWAHQRRDLLELANSHPELSGWAMGWVDAIADLYRLGQTPALNRTDLSRRLCEQLHWRKPNGELKDMTCRVALLRMQPDGLIALPPSRERAPQRRLQPLPTPASDAQPPLLQPVHELGPLTLYPITQRADSRNCRTTGNSAMATAPCCWRPSWSQPAIVAPATRPPTGSMSARPPGAARSVPSTSPSCPSRTSGSIPCIATLPPSCAGRRLRGDRMFTICRSACLVSG